MSPRLYSAQRVTVSVRASEESDEAQAADFFGIDTAFQRPATSTTRQKRIKSENKAASGLMKQHFPYTLTYEVVESAPDISIFAYTARFTASLDQAADLLTIEATPHRIPYLYYENLRDQVYSKVVCAFSDFVKYGKWPETSFVSDGDMLKGEEEVAITPQEWLWLLSLYPTLYGQLPSAAPLHAHKRIELIRLKVIQLTVKLRRQLYLDYLIRRVIMPLVNVRVQKPFQVQPRPPSAPLAPPA